MFPIGIMYYFGTNLDQRFSVPGFWPSKEHTNKVPTERSELDQELERLKARRLHRRQLRLEREALEAGDFETVAKLRGDQLTSAFTTARGREG